MMAIALPTNMGIVDRLLRGSLGSLLLVHGLLHLASPWRRAEALAGGTVLILAVRGFDPLLALLRASTKAGDDKNIFNLAKQTLPGHGDKPMTVQQPVPERIRRQFDPELPLADTLAIGR